MLYIVATPIGNLEDISLRALRILGEVDFVLCEDTRVTSKLLTHYKIKAKTISFHQHSDGKKIADILKLLEEGKDLALVTDAGTPGISDPGGKLVSAVIDKFGPDMKIESVPGPSAVTAALSISGIPTDRFLFMGFPPHKKGRRKFIEELLMKEYPVVVYESKHRILKFLDELKELRGVINERQRTEFKKKGNEYHPKELNSLVVCRELSKMHETVYRGDIETIQERIQENKDDQRGEFVVIVA